MFFWSFGKLPAGPRRGPSRAHSWAAGTLPILPVRSLGGGFEAEITGEWRRVCVCGESGEESCHLQLFKKHCCFFIAPFWVAGGAPAVTGTQAGIWGPAFRAVLTAQVSFKGDMGGCTYTSQHGG